MKVIWLIIFLAGLVACDNSTNIGAEIDSTQKKLDTLVNKVENSAVVDSIKSKGAVILDSVKSKGGKLVDKVDDKITIQKKDSAK